MKEEITLLTKKQIEKSDVLKGYGKENLITDFYIVQKGTYYSGRGECWTKTPYISNSNEVFYSYPSGDVITGGSSDTSFGVRPAISLSQIYKSEEELNKVLESKIGTVEYGEYPQFVVEEDLEEELENLYQEDRLKKTKKSYTSMLKEKEKNIKNINIKIINI